jgi:glucose/arabinose dehydrogenase
VFGRTLRLAVLVGVLVPTSASAGIKATVVGNFSAPTYITAPPSDTHRVFVVEQPGQIEVIKDGGQPTTFLNISSQVRYVGGEQGLLSMAFAPDYATSHRFYVYYTSANCPQAPGCDERVSEFTADGSGDVASAASEHVLMTIPHPGQENHNGGQLQFGPDGDLYISVGDGGGANDSAGNAQRTDRLLGKILRISPGTTSYSVPPGNPFSGGPPCSDGTNGGSNCPEVWAYGLRNPWRFSFDSTTGDMAIADVGQSRDEEVDYAPRGQGVGANYGWPCYEGSELNALRPASECSRLPSPVVAPVLTYPHPQNCAGAPFCGAGIIGGYVMHDPTLPSLDGCYLFGDLSTPGLRLARLAQPSALGSVALGPQVASLSSFGLDASGHLYAADITDRLVYRLDSDGNAATNPTCPPSPTSSSATPPGARPRHPPVNDSAPLIRGLATLGETLTCTPGSWTGASSFFYQWLRDAAPRAAGAAYRPRASDIGHLLSCAVTAANADGNARAVSAKVRVVKPAPPRLSALRISPTEFNPARSGPSVVRNGKRGTIVTFRLDEPAIVTVIVRRVRRGRMIRGRCQRGTRSHRKAQHCTLWSAVRGSFRITGRRGSNRLRFTGRIAGRTLAPGGYRLILRARDRAGSLAKPARARFSIRR